MHVPLSFVCAVTVLYVRPGKDVATNVEVYWPDGRSVARPLEPSDVNTVLEIHYPREEEEVTPTVEIEVQHCFTVILNCQHLKCCYALSNRHGHYEKNVLDFNISII